MSSATQTRTVGDDDASSPHRGADGPTYRTCTSAYDSARRTSNEETSSASEARASQSGAATNGQ
jgi:hypothetical protein